MSIQDKSKGLDSLLLVLLGQMGIALGHLKTLVTKQFFDRGMVCPVYDQMTGEGMSEVVEAEICGPSTAYELVDGGPWRHVWQASPQFYHAAGQFGIAL